MSAPSRAFRGRAVGKLRRNRMALVAMFVVGIYALIGVWLTAADIAVAASAGEGGDFAGDDRGSLFTAMTLDKVDSRVGPLGRRGWFEDELPEARARHVKYYLGKVQKALRLKEPTYRAAALDAIRFGEHRIAVSEDQARSIADAIDKGYHDLDSIGDLDAPEARDSLPRLAALEQQIESLFTPLTGWRAVMYDFRMSLGTDRQGRSTAARAVYSIKVALQIGLIVGLISVLLGAVLGAAAGYYGGWIDHAVQWLYSTLSSVPDLVLLAVLAYMFTGSYFDDTSRPFISLIPVYAAMCMTFWIGPCRVIRGETLKLKELEYVQAAKAIGYSRPYILLRHVLPNTLHLMFINFSLLFIAAIKFEVVLSFLGLGVKAGPSWGRMIGEATQEVINGNFWQIGAATAFMFVLVLAFNVLSDALQDAFDPKHVG